MHIFRSVNATSVQTTKTKKITRDKKNFIYSNKIFFEKHSVIKLLTIPNVRSTGYQPNLKGIRKFVLFLRHLEIFT